MRGGRGARTVAPAITLNVGVPDAETEPTDPFGIDHELRQRVLPAVRFLFERYWRVEASGLHHLPAAGPVILIANHSGALPFDAAMIITAAELQRGRVVRFLYDRFVENLGPVAQFYNRIGGAVAARENAVRLLERGEAVLIFPEGVPGVAKPFGDRYRLRPFTPGFARLALALEVPVIPVAVVGAEEIYPVVGRAEGVGRLLGVPYVPVTPFFPLLGVLGALPLPTKWHMHFGKPMRIVPVEGEARWQRARHEAIRVRRTIQTMVTRLRRRRRSVFFG